MGVLVVVLVLRRRRVQELEEGRGSWPFRGGGGGWRSEGAGSLWEGGVGCRVQGGRGRGG